MKKNKITRIGISLLLCLMMMVSVIVMPAQIAHAYNDGDTVNVTHSWITSFYYDFRGSGLLGSAWGQYEHLVDNTADNQAYCIEPGNPFVNGNRTIRADYSAFSAQQKEYIRSALVYGYNGTTHYGYSWDVEYAATQVMMWAIATNIFNTGTEAT